MQLPDFLTQDKYGDIRLAGHRIGLYHVIADHLDGFSPERIQQQYPTLPLNLIVQVIDFYRGNKGEVDVYLAEVQAASDRLYAATPRIDWEALEKRRQEMKRSEKS